MLSFADGGQGSEYFRLAVEAYAPLILDAIAAIIRDAQRPDLLRVRLIEIVGKPRFKGNAAVQGTLLDLLHTGESPSVLGAAIEALGAVGDGTCVARLVGVAWSIDGDGKSNMRGEVLSLIARLAGDEANRALANLWRTAPDDDARQSILRLLRAHDPATALEIYRSILREEQPVRLTGAQMIARFKTDEFIAFVEYWIANEGDAAVLAALGASKEKQKGISSWSGMKAAGPPDTENPASDSPTAWASRLPDGGIEWLELKYTPAMRAHTVRIYEVNSAGAVVEVQLIDERGTKHSVWKGDDPTKSPGVFEVTFAETAYKVKAVHITLDTRKSRDWNEIDAVELVGPDGRAWAASATASSHYGEDSFDNDAFDGQRTLLSDFGLIRTRTRNR